MELSIVNPANVNEHICLAGIKVGKAMGQHVGRYCGRIFVRTNDLVCCASCMSESPPALFWFREPFLMLASFDGHVGCFRRNDIQGRVLLHKVQEPVNKIIAGMLS